MLTAYRQLLAMMLPRERRRFWILVALVFGLTLIEVGSVVAILPFLRLLTEPELIGTIPVLDWLYRTGGFDSATAFLFWLGLAIFLLTVLGLGLKMVAIWMTTRFALMRSYSFSARLLENYLHQPYEWFLSRHSSALGNAILSEVDQVVSNALLPAMRMVPEAFTVLLIVAALCIVEPEIAIGGALLLGGVYGAIFLGVRRLLEQVGRDRLAANRARFHVVQEATGGAKELKLMGLETGFLQRFREAALRLARAQTTGQVVSNVPRQAIEAVAFGGMIALVLVLLAREDGNLAGIVPTLGLIAAAGMRLIPALQQLYQRGTALKQSEPTLARIYEDLTGLAPAPPHERRAREEHAPLPLERELALADLGYAYPGTETPALTGLSLTVPANTTVGIVGGTGAGKTTLVDIILGLLEPATGEMRVDGTPVTAANRRAWQRTLGYVPQTIFLTDGTLAENIAFGLPRDEIGMEAVERAAKIAALHDFVVSDLPRGYDTEVGERGVRLSGGQRQRVGIARALYHDPSTLIFDEATSALDTLTEAAVMEAVHRIAGRKTILMIAHRLSTVKECDIIFVMRRGRIAASGSFGKLLERDEEFRRMAKDLA